MALKSAWAYRNGKRTMTEATATSERVKQEKLQELESNKAALREKREKAEVDKKERNEKIWEVLKPGDSLDVYGLPNIRIKKKNKLSILDCAGVKWTKKEIFSLS